MEHGEVAQDLVFGEVPSGPMGVTVDRLLEHPAPLGVVAEKTRNRKRQPVELLAPNRSLRRLFDRQDLEDERSREHFIGITSDPHVDVVLGAPGVLVVLQNDGGRTGDNLVRRYDPEAPDPLRSPVGVQDSYGAT